MCLAGGIFCFLVSPQIVHFVWTSVDCSDESANSKPRYLDSEILLQHRTTSLLNIYNLPCVCVCVFSQVLPSTTWTLRLPGWRASTSPCRTPKSWRTTVCRRSKILSSLSKRPSMSETHTHTHTGQPHLNPLCLVHTDDENIWTMCTYSQNALFKKKKKTLQTVKSMKRTAVWPSSRAGGHAESGQVVTSVTRSVLIELCVWLWFALSTPPLQNKSRSIL